jgi:hypothetical protein
MVSALNDRLVTGDGKVRDQAQKAIKLGWKLGKYDEDDVS